MALRGDQRIERALALSSGVGSLVVITSNQNVGDAPAYAASTSETAASPGPAQSATREPTPRSNRSAPPSATPLAAARSRPRAAHVRSVEARGRAAYATWGAPEPPLEDTVASYWTTTPKFPQPAALRGTMKFYAVFATRGAHRRLEGLWYCVWVHLENQLPAPKLSQCRGISVLDFGSLELAVAAWQVRRPGRTPPRQA